MANLDWRGLYLAQLEQAQMFARAVIDLERDLGQTQVELEAYKAEAARLHSKLRPPERRDALDMG